MKDDSSCPKCRDVGYCIYCGHINYEEDSYVSWRSESEAAYLLANFVEGTKWILYDHWGDGKAIVTVIGGRVRGRTGERMGQKVILKDWSEVTVDMDNLAAKPL